MSSSTKRKRKGSAGAPAPTKVPDAVFAAAVEAAFAELVQTFPVTKFTQTTYDVFFSWAPRKTTKDGDIDRIKGEIVTGLHATLQASASLVDVIAASELKDAHSIVDAVARKIKQMLRNCLHQRESRKRTKDKGQSATQLIEDRVGQTYAAASLLDARYEQESRDAHANFMRRSKARSLWVP